MEEESLGHVQLLHFGVRSRTDKVSAHNRMLNIDFGVGKIFEKIKDKISKTYKFEDVKDVSTDGSVKFSVTFSATKEQICEYVAQTPEDCAAVVYIIQCVIRKSPPSLEEESLAPPHKPLLGLGRKVVKFGSLKKRTEESKWKVSHVALVSGKLVFLKSAKIKDSLIRGVVSLVGATLMPDGLDNFDLRAGGRRVFFRVEGNRHNRNQWLEAFAEAVLLESHQEPGTFVTMRRLAESHMSTQPPPASSPLTSPAKDLPPSPLRGASSGEPHSPTFQSLTSSVVRSSMADSADASHRSRTPSGQLSVRPPQNRLGLSAHFFLNFSVVKIQTSRLKPERRVVHLDTTTRMVEIVFKEAIRKSYSAADILHMQQGPSGSVDPKALLSPSSPTASIRDESLIISLHLTNGKMYEYQFQTVEDRETFEVVVAEMRDSVFQGIARFPRAILHKGVLDKRGKMGAFSPRFVVLVPRKLFMLRQKTSYFPLNAICIAEGQVMYDGHVHLEVVCAHKAYVFRAGSPAEASEWLCYLLESCTMSKRRPALQQSPREARSPSLEAPSPQPSPLSCSYGTPKANRSLSSPHPPPSPHPPLGHQNSMEVSCKANFDGAEGSSPPRSSSPDALAASASATHSPSPSQDPEEPSEGAESPHSHALEASPGRPGPQTELELCEEARAHISVSVSMRQSDADAALGDADLTALRHSISSIALSRSNSVNSDSPRSFFTAVEHLEERSPSGSTVTVMHDAEDAFEEEDSTDDEEHEDGDALEEAGHEGPFTPLADHLSLEELGEGLGERSSAEGQERPPPMADDVSLEERGSQEEVQPETVADPSTRLPAKRQEDMPVSSARIDSDEVAAVGVTGSMLQKSQATMSPAVGSVSPAMSIAAVADPGKLSAADMVPSPCYEEPLLAGGKDASVSCLGQNRGEEWEGEESEGGDNEREEVGLEREHAAQEGEVVQQEEESLVRPSQVRACERQASIRRPDVVESSSRNAVPNGVWAQPREHVKDSKPPGIATMVAQRQSGRLDSRTEGGFDEIVSKTSAFKFWGVEKKNLRPDLANADES